MTVDKETLIKHRFWLLLGGFLLVWVIAICMMFFSAPDAIKAKRDPYEAASKEIETASTAKGGPKNDSFLKPWEKYAEQFIHHKNEIWKQAWDVQSELFTWPTQDMANLMNNLLTVRDDVQVRREFQEIGYPGQLTELKDQGITGPVEFLGGFQQVMSPAELKNVPTREECFLVQEDFWVKRDLLYVIAATDNAVAAMEVTPLEKKPEGVLAAYRLRNINWEITLLIEQGKRGSERVISTRSTVQNVHPSRRTQYLANPVTGSVVTIALGQQQWQMISLVGEPLPWGAAPVEFLQKPVPLTVDLTSYKEKPFYALQVFDWWTCPVKRIDAIKIPYQSSRTVTTALKSNDFLAKLDAPREGAPEGGAPGMPPVPGMPPGGMPGMKPPGMPAPGMPGPGMGGPKMPGQEGGGDNLTPNNEIDRARYLQAPMGDKDSEEKPCRHLPFAMRIIIDQSQVEDFLVALANSRLRVQITQVEMVHARDIRPEQAGASPDSGEEKGPPGMNGGRPRPPRNKGEYPQAPMIPGQVRTGMPNRMTGRMPGMGMGMIPPPVMVAPRMMVPGMSGTKPRGPQGGDRDNPALSQDDSNLVELTVYAICTLYRKPEERKPEPATGPGAPAGPMGPGNGPPANPGNPAGGVKPAGGPQGGGRPPANPGAGPENPPSAGK